MRCIGRLFCLVAKICTFKRRGVAYALLPTRYTFAGNEPGRAYVAPAWCCQKSVRYVSTKLRCHRIEEGASRWQSSFVDHIAMKS